MRRIASAAHRAEAGRRHRRLGSVNHGTAALIHMSDAQNDVDESEQRQDVETVTGGTGEGVLYTLSCTDYKEYTHTHTQVGCGIRKEVQGYHPHQIFSVCNSDCCEGYRSKGMQNNFL